MTTTSWRPFTDPFQPTAELRRRLHAARVIFLGETNHFVCEKTDFRLGWLKAIAGLGPFAIAEELGWADGRRFQDFIFSGDDDALTKAATFSGEQHKREDRDDSPRGIFRIEGYPHRAMREEHRRLGEALRLTPNLTGYFGLDIDAPGAGYPDTGRSRRSGETISEEITRLEGNIDSEDVRALIDSLRYAMLIRDVERFEDASEAMAFRELAMQRRLDHVLATLPANTRLVVMGHAFHLAKHDHNIEKVGVGPGGNLIPSLGHYIAHEKTPEIASIWMIHGDGEDSQPLAGLPNRLRYSAESLNRKLSATINAPAVLETADDPELTDVIVGHLYNLEVRVALQREADAITFFPAATPLPDAASE